MADTKFWEQDQPAAPGGTAPSGGDTSWWEQDRPAAQRDLPAGVRESTAGAGRGRVAPPAAPAPREEPMQGDPMGTGFAEIVNQPPRRQSVLEGVDLPEPTITPEREAENIRLSRRDYAERTPTIDDPRLNAPSLRASRPTETNPNVARGARLADASVPVRAAAKTITQGVQGLGGVVRAAGDVTGSRAVSDFGANASRNATAFEQGMGDTPAIQSDATLFGPKSPVHGAVDLTNYSRRMGEGAASSLAQSIGMATAFGPRAVIPMMTLQQAGQTYDDARNAGMSPGDALGYALPYGAFEAIGEKFTGMDKAAGALRVLMTRGASRSAIRQAGTALVDAGVREVPGEVVTYLGQSGMDLLPGIGLRQDMTVAQWLDGLRDTVVQASMMGGATAAGGIAARSAEGAAPRQQTAEELARAKGFLVQQQRIKVLNAQGEKEVAGVLQRRLDTEQAEAELQVLADKPYGQDADFQQRYRTMRAGGMKPGEAAARASMASGFAQMAGQAGLTPKAVQAAVDAAAKLPLDQVPAFLERYTAGLNQGGMGQPLPQGAVSGAVGAVGDDAMNTAVDNIARILGVPQEAEKSAGDAGATAAPAAEESATVAPEAVSREAASVSPVAASVSPEAGFDTGNDVRVTPEHDQVHAAATSPTNELPEPTQAQKEAGNYRMGHLRIGGLDISVENPQGSVRRGVDADGNPWETPLQDHYGYMRGTVGADKDHLDVFVKPGTPADYRGPVFVVDQVDPRTGKFDEAKVVLGAADRGEAEQVYRRNYSAEWQGLGAITELPMPAFQAWARSKKTKEPLGDISEASAAAAARAQQPAAGAAAAAPVPAPAAVPAPARGEQGGGSAALEAPAGRGEPAAGVEEQRGKSYDEMTPEEQAAYDKRQGIPPGRREEVAAGLRRIEEQSAATRAQIEAVGPKGAREAQPKTKESGAEIPSRETGKGKPDAEPAKARAIAITRNPSGTLAVAGDAAQIKDILAKAGVTRVMAGKSGILVGKTQAAQAEKVLSKLVPKEAKPQAEKPAAPQPLTVGTAPGSAEAVTVKDGVIHIGKYEALDFDSGEPVKAPANASAEDLKRLLKEAGAITSRQKFFGGQEAKPAETAARRGIDLSEGPPLTTDQVRAAVREITGGWENGPAVHVVLSPRQLPGENGMDVRGLYTRDQGLWIVASLNRSRSALARTLAHEAIAHYGLRDMLGRDRFERLMANIQTGADQGGELQKLREEVRHTYVDGNGKNYLSPGLEADEVAALAVERAVGPDGKFRPGFEWAKSVYAAVMEFLRDLGINFQFTNAELQGMLLRAQQHLEAGKRTAGGGDLVLAAARDGQEERAQARADKPLAVPDVLVASKLGTLNKHPDYSKAKGGDNAAALNVARDVVTPEVVQRVRDVIGQRTPIVVPVVAEEAAGRNKIPLAAAEVLAHELGLKTSTDIVQANRAHRTGKDGYYRILNPVDFDGPVQAGQDYLILDDTITQGGTLAALASHIREGGGNVVSALALTGFESSAKIDLDPTVLTNLRRKHASLEDQFRAVAGHGFDALTNAEARYLIAQPPERLRDRLAEEGRSRSQRLDEGPAGEGKDGVGDAFDGSAQARTAPADAVDKEVQAASPARPLSKWRDATGRLQFAPGQALYDLLGKAADPVLSALQMKAASTPLRRALREMKNQVRKAQETAAAVAGEANKLTPAERAMVSDIVEKELAAGTVPPEHAVRLASLINDVMGKQTDELVRLGMLEEGSAEKWRGQYLPRYYESKLTKKAADAWADAMRRITGRPRVMRGISGKHLKGRGLYETIPESQLADYEALGWEVRDPDYVAGQPTEDGTVQVWRDFSREEREKMGEIRDAGFRFVMGYMQTQRDIALGRMFEALAGDASISSRTQSETMNVQVPTSTVPGTGAKTYGKLSGRWVSKDTLSHLSAIEEAQSEALQMYRKGMAIWKEGKTALNPVSHMNNVLSNLTMAHFAGVSYWEGHKYLGAVRDLATKSDMVTEAKDAGLFGGTLSEAELMNMLPPELRALARQQEGAAQKAGRTAFNILTFYLRRPMGWAYQAEDSFFRYLIYRDARRRGLDPQDAVDYAQRFIFAYDDLPKGARRIRDFGIPFFSYTYKAAPALLHTALTHPLRFAAPAAVLWAANAAAYAIAAGDDDDDWEEKLRKYLTDPAYRQKARELEQSEREHLPPWMKGSTSLLTPKTLRLGMDEVTKLPLFIDMSRVIPGGDLFDVSPNAGGLPIPQPITPSHPLFTTAVAMIGNKDLFFGKEIVDSNDTRPEAVQKRADWLWKQLSPAIAAGNYHWERGMNALAQATGKEVRWLPESIAPNAEATGIGRDALPVQPKYAAMQTFGIKVRPIDIDKSEAIDESLRKKMIRDIDAELRSMKRLYGLGAISDRALERAEDLAAEKKARLKEGLTVDGDEKR